VDVADPGGYLVSDWTCEGGYNLAQYCDPDTDQQIQDAVAIEDTDQRNAAYQELATRLQEEAASVFLVHENAIWGIQKSVENFQPHPLDMYVLTADLALG
jgi:peptide/nickel transport system substrate-binding protein